jgi:Tol biopolymer transport system component
VLYTDAIPNQQLAGTYAVPADGSGPPAVFWPSAATVSPDSSRIAFPDFAANITRIQEFGKQTTATISNNAAYVWFSMDGRQVAWLERAPGAQPSSNVDRLVRVWVANADGSNARRLGPTVRAADLTWFPDGNRLLFTGRDTDGGNPGIYVLDIAAGALTRVVAAFSPRGARLSPDGTHIAYLAALEENPDDNGLFIVKADGSEKQKLPLLGGVRWSPDSQSLIILPFQTDNGPDQLVRIDAATLATTSLTDRAALPFRVAQDEWQLAPDGSRIVFTALQDGNIYVLRFRQ